MEGLANRACLPCQAEDGLRIWFSGAGLDSRKMMDRTEQSRLEEIEEFESLSETDRKWICFYLDAAEGSLGNWGNDESLPIFSAADLLSTAVALFRREYAKEIDYRFSAGLYPELMRAGAFIIQFDHCTTYKAFRFLMERLFGGVSRPFIPSVFMALAAHPSFAESLSSGPPLLRPEEIEDALLEAQRGWGTFDCIFRPKYSAKPERD